MSYIQGAIKKKNLRLCLLRKNRLRHWLCDCERVIKLTFVCQGSLIFLYPRAGAHLCCETGTVSQSLQADLSTDSRMSQNLSRRSSILVGCFALTTKQVVFAGEEPKVPKHEVQNKEHALHCFLQHSVCALWIHPQCQTVNEVCSNVLREKIQATQTLARRQLGGDIAQVLWPHRHTHYPPYALCCCWTSKSLQAVCLDHPCSQNELHIKQQLLFGSCGWDAACRKDYFTFKDTVSKLSDCTLYTCVCVCGSAPDSQHGVDLPDEVAELVHDLFQVLVLLLQLL